MSGVSTVMLAVTLFATAALHAGSDLDALATSPTDIVTLRSGETLTVRPLARPLGKESLTLVPADAPDKPRLVAPGDIASIESFEARYLKLLATLPGGPTELQAIERLHARIRQQHFAFRDVLPLQTSPWQAIEAALEDKGDEIRRKLLHALCDGTPIETEWRKADELVMTWLAGARLNSPLRVEARGYWVRRGLQQYGSGDFAAAKSTLERFERTFPNHSDADELRAKILARAATLVERAASESAATARNTLVEARNLWPGTSGLAAAWKRVEPDLRALRIASPRPPSAFTPDTATSPEDHVALDLLYQRLPHVLQSFPAADAQLALTVRSDLSWSDGRRITADDVRHTLREHLKSRAGKGLAEVLDEPRGEAGPFDITLSLRRGLFEPWRALRIPVMPRDAKPGIGSGPYVLDEKQTGAALFFRTNPYYPGPARPFDDVRWTCWNGADDKDPPHVVWDASPGERDTLAKAGYRDWRVLTPPRVWYVALNLQRTALSNADLRRALAHAVQRDKILDQFFRMGQKLHASANGPFVPGSTAQAPAARVAASLDQPLLAASFAKKAAAEMKNVDLTLLAPKGDPRWNEVLTHACQQWQDTLKAAGINSRFAVKDLEPALYRDALEKGDFDMAIAWIDRAENVLPLATLTGGDPRLRQLFSQLLRHRQASVVREQLQDFHAALVDRMPIIPLWRLDIIVAVHGSVTMPALDPLHPFAK